MMEIQETAISLRQQLADLVRKHCRVEVRIGNILSCDRKAWGGGFYPGGMRVTSPGAGPEVELFRTAQWYDIEVHVEHRDLLAGAERLAVEYEALSGAKCILLKEC